MCCLLKKLRKARRKSTQKLLKTILAKLEKLMATAEELLTKVGELEQNASDTADGISAVATSLAEQRAEIEALRELLAGAEGNAAAIVEATERLGALVVTTQANEDALNALPTPAPVDPDDEEE